MSCQNITLPSLSRAVAIVNAAWNIFFHCFFKEHLLRKNSPWPMTPLILKTRYLDPRHYNASKIHFLQLHIITNLPHIVYAYRLVSVQSIHGDHCSLNKIVFADIHKENWFPPLDVIKTSKENFTFFYNFVFRDYCLFSTNFWISYQTSVNTFPSVSITFFSRKRASHLIATMTSSRSNITCWLRLITS